MKYLSDLMLLVGVGVVSYGAWLLDPAVGAITCGSLLIAAALARGRADAVEEYKKLRGIK